MENSYGMMDGKPIAPPKGWVVLSEGADIPQVHRYYDEECRMWCHPRRCHSTMTPFVAGICGFIQAYAVPETEEIRQRVIKYGY